MQTSQIIIMCDINYAQTEETWAIMSEQIADFSQLVNGESLIKVISLQLTPTFCMFHNV